MTRPPEGTMSGGVRRLETALAILLALVAAMDQWAADAASDDDTLDRLDDIAAMARALLAEIGGGG